MYCRGGGIGRRAGLRGQFPLTRSAGSSPVPDTMTELNLQKEVMDQNFIFKRGMGYTSSPEAGFKLQS